MRTSGCAAVISATAFLAACAAPRPAGRTPVELIAVGPEHNLEIRVADQRDPVLLRLVQDHDRAHIEAGLESRSRDAIAIEEREPGGAWTTIRWVEAREGSIAWFPVDFDADGTDEVVLERSVGRGNEGTAFVTILRRSATGWHEALEVRSPRPVAIAAAPSNLHPPYGYVTRDVSFAKRNGVPVIVIETTVDLPEGTSLLDASTIAEVHRRISILRFDDRRGGFTVVDD